MGFESPLVHSRLVTGRKALERNRVAEFIARALGRRLGDVSDDVTGLWHARTDMGRLNALMVSRWMDGKFVCSWFDGEPTRILTYEEVKRMLRDKHCVRPDEDLR